VVKVCYSGCEESPAPIVLKGDETVEVSIPFCDALWSVSGSLQKQVHMHNDGTGHVGIWADLTYGVAPIDSVTGFLAWCAISGDTPLPPYPPTPPIPPLPPPPPPPLVDDALSQLPVVESAREALFPYLYMRKWPQPAPDLLAQCFVHYVAPDVPPESSLYGQLLSADGAARRQTLAVQYIDGSAPFTPGQYLRGPESLGGTAQRLPAVAPLLMCWLDDPEHCPFVLRRQIEELFGVSDCLAMQACLAAPEFLADVERLWQSYFALVLVLGYERAWMECVTEMLMAQHALVYLFTPAPLTTPLQPGRPLATPELVRHLLDASVVAPAAVSPPPATTGAGLRGPVGAGGWIEPYAIGDLHLVRQRLLGYRLGEVAHVENVMRGERKEVSRRRLQRQLEHSSSDSLSDEALDNQSTDLRHHLYAEMRATVAEKNVSNIYDKLKSSYGPPTSADLSGQWTERTEAGTRPGSDDATRFAQALLNATVGRVRRTVSHARSSSTLQQSEEAVSSLIDNAGGATPLTAVFHWVNQVYETDVVNYGKRLLVEFMLTRPAADFVREQSRMEGRTFARPVAPAAKGITSFRSIEPLNYADLAALYEVAEIEPPPQAVRMVSATLRSGDEKLVPIPSGSRAVAAQVRHLAGAQTQPPPVVLVGTEQFDGTAERPSRRFGQDGAMPVSVSPCAEAQPALAPTPTPTPVPPPLQAPTPAALVNVDIECHPDATLMDQWRIQTYAAIMRAYQLQLARFFELGAVRAAPHGPVRSPRANRDIERAALRRGCLRLLMDRRSPADGQADAPSEFDVNEPRYLQFFDTLLEWGEMSYRWYGGDGGPIAADDPGAGEDAEFTQFLSADLARVMLPVAPEHVMALLYFLSSGQIWEGGNRAAPLNSADIAVAADLKQAGLQRTRSPQRVGACWEVVVPTTMQLLRDQLPLLQERAV
jgi:hypothetical protein